LQLRELLLLTPSSRHTLAVQAARGIGEN